VFTVTMWIAFVLGFCFTAFCLKFADYVIKKTGIEDESES